MTLYNEIVAATEPHDQIGLAAAVVLLALALIKPGYSMWLIVASIILIVAVLVDLTAHGWDH